MRTDEADAEPVEALDDRRGGTRALGSLFDRGGPGRNGDDRRRHRHRRFLRKHCGTEHRSDETQAHRRYLQPCTRRTRG